MNDIDAVSPVAAPHAPSTDTVPGLLAEIEAIGADRLRGGYSRPVFSAAELELREWFIAHATKRGLDVEIDPVGTIRAWWHTPSRTMTGAVLTGSHLDSVPGGGAFDGPLGIASALVAVDLLRARGFVPEKPLVVAAFPEEEGSRFGVACLGSRLLTGAITPERALALRDNDGDTFAEVLTRNGFSPEFVGPDVDGVRAFDSFVELHVEQGRALVDHDAAVAIGSSILGHGRWRASIRGEGNHAGTTLMSDRRDPMVAAARAIQTIRDAARTTPDARATVGRLQPVPGGTNVIASRVDFWIDVRHPDDVVTAALVESIRNALALIAAEEGCEAELTEESFSATTHFDTALRGTLESLLPDAPVLDTGAGHDAGVLASLIPTSMLFVRNPTGISHSPEEYTTDLDAQLGAEKLADVLQGLLVA
ncbi:allantoate amidohydrolase [Salinibacterium sp. SWN1162]|uniref:allantoate amidohydrolase n=1 Tax=Salinibacterium sp. SWN1162 TaxID=2792053 RepID=UPI0018CD8D1A|nr:allantoate amidohydrolase [Salinibacterium sp. SWN1162]MBH0008282.1 allantoate amidohydrolase [Salinibacterium sp. SWN1162]